MSIAVTPLVATAGDERIRVVSPLGIRFWDPVTDSQVTEGLRVRAQPVADDSARAVTATVTPGGIFAFRRLPGMQPVEHPRDLDETDFGTTTDFVVTVVDRSGRYLPARFTVAVPQEGIFPASVGGDPGNGAPEGPRGFYLFPTPARVAPAGTATVRAQLVVDDTDAPAPFAVLRVDVDATSFFGISNPAGAVAVQFPYPSFAALPDISSTDAIAPQQWAVTVSVRSQPSVLGEGPFDPAPAFEDITNQAAAAIHLDTTSTAPEMPAVLDHGRELVLRTSGTDRSDLRIAPPS